MVLLDLKWLVMTPKAALSGSPTALKAWASGSRALANGTLLSRTFEGPTSFTVLGS